MKELQITEKNEGTRLFRILVKLMPLAEKNFLYKMLRKKNITLNDTKATGSEILKSGDLIRIYFSDDTFEKFSKTQSDNNYDVPKERVQGVESKRPEKILSKDRIIYEDADILLCCKPAGILSQKASKSDVSMVEIIAEYLKSKGEYDPDDDLGFKPAVTNRLDRNTSGVIAAGKSVSGLKLLSEGFKNRSFEKLYLCVVKGELDKELLLNGLWSKSSHGNRVVIKNVGDGKNKAFPREYFVKGNIPVQTSALPLKTNGRATLCLVRLMTGKTHQIRAQMAEAGYPLLGDQKYGDKVFNEYYRLIYKQNFQLLHAYMLHIPGRGVFFASIPDYFEKLLISEDLWVHGIREVFEAQLLRI